MRVACIAWGRMQCGARGRRLVALTWCYDSGSYVHACGPWRLAFAQLSDVGILTRQMFHPGIAVYELRRDQAHDHLVCLECDRVDEFTDDVVRLRPPSI